MNYGSIHNPTTREARLFAFLKRNVGVRFTANELDVALQDFGHSPCAHSYVAGVRLQLELEPQLGYVLPKSRKCPQRKLYVYWLEAREPSRAVPSAGQMSLGVV